jgi:ATP-dependent RNA helicase DeaD
LVRQLAAQGYPVAALQGNMSQNARDRVVADFRSGQVPVLLATNVAARGLDVLSIEQVINYELPESAELFTHRVGRTGRMDREGEAITIITPDDMPAWQKLQRDLSVKLQLRPWPQDRMPLPQAPAAPQGQSASAGPRRGVPAVKPAVVPSMPRPERPYSAQPRSDERARPRWRRPRRGFERGER